MAVRQRNARGIGPRGQAFNLCAPVASVRECGHNLVSSALHLSPVPVRAARRYVPVLGGTSTGSASSQAVLTGGRT